MKKYVSYALCISLLITAFADSHAQHIEGYSALKNYVEHSIAQLFYPNHDIKEVKSFTQSLADKIHNQEATWFSLWVNYDQGKVYQIIIGETINFIARQAGKYGSRRASELIKEEVTRKIMSYRELPTGILSEYIGSSLHRKVARIESTSNHRPETAPVIYPSEECCICYSTFDGTIKQIFLKPCGHDLCRECSKSHFFDFGNRTCPTCRQVVNKELLQKAIFKKSKNRSMRSVWD